VSVLLDQHLPVHCTTDRAPDHNSSNLQIGTAADCPNSIPCDDVTYDDGFGIYLQNTHDVVINQVTSERTTSAATSSTDPALQRHGGESPGARNRPDANSGLSIASGGAGFYVNSWTGQNQSFTPEAAMGSGSPLSNICYSNTNISTLRSA
jgi:hypothetical protein